MRERSIGSKPFSFVSSLPAGDGAFRFDRRTYRSGGTDYYKETKRRDGGRIITAAFQRRKEDMAVPRI